MKDKRCGLKQNTLLEIDDERKVIICNEIGRGATGIVYNAEYIDGMGISHNVRVKECYPNNLPMERTMQGNLETDFFAKFDEAKRHFVESYRCHTKIRNTEGLVNSTMPAREIFEKNQTYYMVMSFDEGIAYGDYMDASLKELFEHIKSLVKLLRKYHENGYLHLDLKPENIFILPETRQHILLFDFDSVIAIKELKREKEWRISFSDGFSAPEQKRGDIKKIGFYTDIFSVGAIVFYKIFGRKPEFLDCLPSAKFDFSKMIYQSQKLSPAFYRNLENFFRKTLSCSPILRWKKMDDVLQSIEKLLIFSDIKNIFINDSFSYHFSDFIGREEEIKMIHEKLSENPLVFLSGMGGIGKTELAKKYAQTFRKKYNSILYYFYESDIQSLVNLEIQIHGIAVEEGESEENYFERKRKILKEILTPKDLLIIDNFDVEMDENLEKLLECPCKFIITTREDFRDFHYAQININGLEKEEDILALFTAYNDNEYSEAEITAIKQIITKVERHTMTVELIAKYLRDTMESPIVLWHRFCKKEGINNTEEMKIKQRKDEKLRAESMNKHLRILFDVSHFDMVEKEIMRCLSLFGGIRIAKTKFLEICNCYDCKKKDKINHLIRRGWIEYSEMGEKISLHQLIQDLVYQDLKPNAENCSFVVTKMMEFMKRKTESYTEKRLKRKIFRIFMERLTGNSLLFAQICIFYGNELYLNQAEIICERYLAKNRESCGVEVYKLLKEIYCKKIKEIAESEDIFTSQLKFEEYCEEKYKEINILLEKIINIFAVFPGESDEDAKEFVILSIEIDRALNGGMMHLSGAHRIKEVDWIYGKIEDLLESATERILFGKLSSQNKIELLKKIRDFYTKEDFTAMYRCAFFSDMEKAFWYQKKINEIRKQEEKQIGESNNREKDREEIELLYSDDLTYTELALDYERKEEFLKAILYYKKAYEAGEELYQFTASAIAKLYAKTGDLEKAATCLEEVLKRDKAEIMHSQKYEHYSGFVCVELLKFLRLQKNFTKERTYAKELLFYCKCQKYKKNQGNDGKNKKEETGYSKYQLALLIEAYFHLYRTDESEERECHWNQCVKYFRLLDFEKELPEEIHEFLLTYIKKSQVSETSLREIAVLLKKIKNWKADIYIIEAYNNLLGKCEENLQFKKWHLYFLLDCSRYLRESFFGEDIHNKQATDCCKKALECYQKYEMKNDYYKNWIWKSLAESLTASQDADYMQIENIKKKCDYIFLAKKKIKERNCQEKENDNQDEYNPWKIWTEAADAYASIDDDAKEIYCQKKVLKTIVSDDKRVKYGMFLTYKHSMDRILKGYIRLKKYDKAYTMLQEFYENTIKEIQSSREIYDAHKQFGRIKEIAENMKEIKKYKAASEIYLYAIYFACRKEKPPKELLKIISKTGEETTNSKANAGNKTNTGTVKKKDFYPFLEKQIKQELTKQAVDDVFSVLNELDFLGKKKVLGEDYRNIFQWFSRNYLENEIEFKS